MQSHNDGEVSLFGGGGLERGSTLLYCFRSVFYSEVSFMERYISMGQNQVPSKVPLYCIVCFCAIHTDIRGAGVGTTVAPNKDYGAISLEVLQNTPVNLIDPVNYGLIVNAVVQLTDRCEVVRLLYNL